MPGFTVEPLGAVMDLIQLNIPNGKGTLDYSDDTLRTPNSTPFLSHQSQASMQVLTLVK